MVFQQEKQILLKGVTIMTTLTIKTNQKPSKDTLKRLSELKDEDIVYDDFEVAFFNLLFNNIMIL